MQSNNPVFSRSAAFNGRGRSAYQTAPSAHDLQSMYDAPSATPVQTRRMTLDDVIMKTAAMFAVLLVFAAGAWYMTPSLPVLPWVGMIGGLVLGLVISFKQSTNPALHLGYAALEGLFVGGISIVLQSYVDVTGDGTNIVGQAVLGTLAAFTVMLVLNRTGVLKATPKFQKMFMVAAGAYLLVALASFVSSFFGAGAFGFRDSGMIGILICVAGVALASFSLILDFDFIENGIRNGAPERMAWLGAFGLIVSLVWLYIELLRLLAILRGGD